MPAQARSNTALGAFSRRILHLSLYCNRSFLNLKLITPFCRLFYCPFSVYRWVGYPGQSGGQALAEVVYGEVAPSGRTPNTWYYNAYAADGSPTMIDMLDMGALLFA